MSGWVALLRGVNLGARNKVPMAHLRRVLEDAGYGDVRTYIQSGNVLFTKAAKDRDALARELERLVEAEFGVQSRVVLRTFAEIREVVAARPFGKDTSYTHVSFLAEPPERAAVRRAHALDVEPDRVKVVGSDVYLELPNGVQGARLSMARVEQELGAATMRTFKTVAKLAEMAE